IGKIEEGKMPVAREPIVLAEVVDDVVREYVPVAEQAGGRRGGGGAPGPPPGGGGARRPPGGGGGGPPRRRPPHRGDGGGGGSVGGRVEGGRRGGVVTLSVVDFGRGIAEEDQARVFEKFRTVRRSPTDDPGGDTGLGLPFCRLAVERMGGRMSLVSSADAG